MTTFDRFESRTYISAVLHMVTALSIGSRTSLEPTGTDLPVAKNVMGEPFIPGSSVKGVVRAHMERVLRSLDATYGLSACDPLAAPCVPEARKKKLVEESGGDDRRFSELVWEASCTACRVFGSNWFASRISIKDAPLMNLEDLPQATQVRDGVGIDRDLGSARDGVKYDFEVAVPGSRFAIEMVGENMAAWEIGLLLAILRPWRDGHMPLGGKSTRGPGWGHLESVAIRRVEQHEMLDYLLGGQPKLVPEQVFLQALRQRLDGERG